MKRWKDLNRSCVSPLLPDQTCPSPVQEAVLSWQPHTCEGKAGMRRRHTHTCTHSALVGSLNNWSALRALHVTASQTKVVFLPVSSTFVFRCVYHIYWPSWPLTSDLLQSTAFVVDDVAAGNLQPHFRISESWEAVVVFTEAEMLSLVGLNIRGGATHVGLDKIPIPWY